VGCELVLFLPLKDLLIHRLVSAEFCSVVATVPLDSNETITGPLKFWHACFPKARTANLDGIVLNDDAADFLRGVHKLSLCKASIPKSFFHHEFPNASFLNLAYVIFPLLVATTFALFVCLCRCRTSLLEFLDSLECINNRGCKGITDASLQHFSCPNLVALEMTYVR
jgi:hypothetical protein